MKSIIFIAANGDALDSLPSVLTDGYRAKKIGFSRIDVAKADYVGYILSVS